MQREIVEQAIGGDHESFSVLVRGSIARLYGIAHLILRDGETAQDAVQDALISAWRDVRALRDPDAWDAWLYRLTVRACHRSARKERRRNLVELHVMPDPEPAERLDLTLSVAERDRLERRLGDLPLDQRTVLVLHYFADLLLEDVASVLDIPVGTAKSRLHRGLRAMREAMAAEPEAHLRVIEERSA